MEELGSWPWDPSKSMIQKLDDDSVIHVMKFLDTPSDLARVACVSRSWWKHVCEGSLWKGMCIKIFPEVGKFESVIEPGSAGCSDLASSSQNTLQSLERESCLYSQLLCKLQAPPITNSCILEPLYASSTDNFPRESITETLFPRPRYADGARPSYWSSKGQMNKDVPETLTYLLVSSLCVIHEVRIQPFLAFFQPGNPIYSAKSVRFRFGYIQSQRPGWNGLLGSPNGSSEGSTPVDCVWTYESPEFPMKQEDSLQIFKLPRPVLCIGGVLQIEFLGRVQTQQTDELYYICISHVSACGNPLLSFDFEPIGGQNKYLLKHLGDGERRALVSAYSQLLSFDEETSTASSRPQSPAERLSQTGSNRIGQWNRSIFGMLLGNWGVTRVLAGITKILMMVQMMKCWIRLISQCLRVPKHH